MTYWPVAFLLFIMFLYLIAMMLKAYPGGLIMCLGSGIAIVSFFSDFDMIIGLWGGLALGSLFMIIYYFYQEA